MKGTLTRNTDPYQKCPSIHPLRSGPIMPAAPLTPAQIAIAFVRSCAGNTFTRIERVEGMMNAAQPPMNARQAMICHIDVEADASSTPKKKPTRPSCSAPLRPYRSPIAPAVNSSPANTNE